MYKETRVDKRIPIYTNVFLLLTPLGIVKRSILEIAQKTKGKEINTPPRKYQLA